MFGNKRRIEALEELLAALEERTSKEHAELTSENEALRKEIAKLQPKTAAHIPPFCFLGPNTDIAPTVHFMAPHKKNTIRIGERTKIRRGAEWIGPITVGKYCSFNRDSYIRANVTIGNYCNIGAFTKIISDTHAIGGTQRRAGAVSFEPITIGNGVFIGASVTILGGVTIGDSAVIAAGSLVNKDVPPNTVYGGVPAKKIRDLDAE